MSDAPDDAQPPAGLRAANQRLLRVDGDKGMSLAEKLADHVRHLGYRTPLHRLRLRGRYPLRLLGVPVDPVTGDAEAGAAIVQGRMSHAGYNVAAASLAFDDPAAPAAWRDWANGFAWLRDLAAASPRERGARIAEPLVVRWLTQNGDFDAASWRPDLVGSRLLFWAAYAPYILSSGDLVYRSAVLNAMARWARHLDRAAARLPGGLPAITAFAGLVTAGLLIQGGEGRLRRGETGLVRTLDAVLLADGGTVTRAPRDGVDLLEILLLVAAVYRVAETAPPAALDEAVLRLVAALKGVTRGDGAIGAWHGGGGIAAARLAQAIAAAGVAPVAAALHGAQSGYQRLTGGRTILVVDAGPPPIARVAPGAHAGTLAFEMSDGAVPMIVNCGGAGGLPRPLPEVLAAGLRTTAAHSTLILDDINSTRIRADGALGRGVEEVVASRQASEEGSWLDLSHDGYARRHGVHHRRRLFVSADGTDVRGEDSLEPVGRRRAPKGRIDVRFHLGPGVEATPTADAHGALLRLPDGRVWQFRARGGGLAVEASLWLDPDGRPRATQQLVVTAAAADTVAWTFKRTSK